jgi:ribosomal protein L24
MTRVAVKVGDQVYVREGGTSFGAVQTVMPHELMVFIEGTGAVSIPAVAVTTVHDGKVVVDANALSPEIRKSIALAHSKEDPRL